MGNHGEVLVEDPLPAEAGEMPSTAIEAADIKGFYPMKELGGQIVQRCQSTFRPVDICLTSEFKLKSPSVKQ